MTRTVVRILALHVGQGLQTDHLTRVLEPTPGFEPGDLCLTKNTLCSSERKSLFLISAHLFLTRFMSKAPFPDGERNSPQSAAKLASICRRILESLMKAHLRRFESCAVRKSCRSQRHEPKMMKDSHCGAKPKASASGRPTIRPRSRARWTATSTTRAMLPVFVVVDGSHSEPPIRLTCSCT